MNENPILTFSLNIEEINAILAALQELPAKIANPMTQKIREQAEVQIKAMQEAEAPKPEAQPEPEAVLA